MWIRGGRDAAPKTHRCEELMILDSGSEARLLWRSGDKKSGDVDGLRA